MNKIHIRIIQSILILLCFISVAFSDENSVYLKSDWFLKSSFLVKGDGQAISSSEFEPVDWYTLNIPSTVLTVLVKNGIYPDPYVGMNNMKIPDASNEFNADYDLSKYSHLPDKRNPWADPYWFWTRFKLPENLTDKIIWLHFEGINYRADVWLNGLKVADSSEVVGMFGKWAFDISKFVNTGDYNTFAVKVYPLDYPGLPSEPQLKAFGPFGPNGGQTGDIGKNVTMQCSVGWDWMPAVRDRNMGIWQDVYITATGPVDIRHPHIISDLPLPRIDKAELEINAEIVNLTGASIKGDLIAKIAPENFNGDEIILQKSIELTPHKILAIRFDKDPYEELILKEPRLWWPNGQGAQNLYKLELLFDQNGQKSDIEQIIFGIREVGSEVTFIGEWARRDFFINGQKVLLKGGAWVPDMMLSRNPEKLSHELRFFKEANLNMVRIWGGGVTPPDEFFTLCDSLGLFVWHDFWITGDCQGTWDKGSQDYPFDEDVFLKNAADVVRKLRNHPSLLVWTAGNEGYPRKDIYVPLRNEILAILDGTRPFIPSSGYRLPPEDWGLSWPDNQVAGTYSGGPYCWVNPREYFKKVGERKDWLFKNETGIPSLPTLESLKKFIPDLKSSAGVKFPLNHIWGYHDACEGNGKYSLYDDAIRRRYGEPKSLGDYITKGQLINAESYRAIFESVNHAMNQVAGVLLWKVNPAWPSVIWQLFDWYLCPNAGYYYTKKACEPLHIQLNIDDLSVSAINNYFESHNNLTAEASVYSMAMQKIWEKKTRIQVGPNMAKEIFKINGPDIFKESVCFVELQLRDNDGYFLSDNFYWLTDDDNFTSLSLLPEAKLDVKIDKRETHKKMIYKILLENPSEHLAFFIHPSILEGKTGEEVLPSFWSDNYFSLLPGRTKKLTVEFQKSDFDGKEAYLKLDGGNIKNQKVKID